MNTTGSDGRCVVMHGAQRCHLPGAHNGYHDFGFDVAAQPATAGFVEEVLPPGSDNWAHRSESMRCQSCMWFVEKQGVGPTQAYPPPAPFGRCRRRAPTLSGWPAVWGTDWCGDHKLDESRLPGGSR